MSAVSDEAVVAALAAAGWSRVGAARLLGVKESVIANRLRRRSAVHAAWRANASRSGRTGRPPKHAELTHDRVLDAIAEHGTQRAAAAALGVSRSGVGKWIVRHGIRPGLLDPPEVKS